MKIIGSGGHAAVVRDCIRAIGHKSQQGLFIAIGDNRVRKTQAAGRNGPFARLIHPRSHVAEDAEIGAGTIIMAGAIVQPRAKIGKHCIINTGATVDHDCVLEDYVHIAPGAHLCGNVHVGEGTLVGVGVGIAPNTTIPAWSLVKAARLDIEPLPSN